MLHRVTVHEFKKGPHVLGVNSHILGLGLALLEHIDPSIHLKHTGSELQFALRQTLYDVLPILQQLHELGITEADVLQRIRAGLPATDLGLTEGEIGWVTGRLAETLGWLDESGQLPGGGVPDA